MLLKLASEVDSTGRALEDATVGAPVTIFRLE
jgi:hypothetical protein